MFKLKMMGGDTFIISKEEAQLFSGKSGLIHIPSLGGLINISSISSILPEELANIADNTKRILKNGTRVINKFGQWFLENSPEVKVDLDYYPELKENTSSFSNLPGFNKPKQLN